MLLQPDQKIRWGVLGYARIARESVIPAIQRSKNSVFYGIASRDSLKLEACRNRFRCPKTYSDYTQMLRDPNVDAVYIPLPNSLHKEWTIKAAECGKHVLCEKPIALNAAECREMVAACAANKVVLMEAFMYRYNERINKVIEVIRSGSLGEIKFVSATFRFFLNRPNDVRIKNDLGGGALYDVGCYPVNFIGLVADEIARKSGVAGSIGEAPSSVSVECVKVDGVDMILSGLMKYPSGLLAALNCGFNAQKSIHAEIVGTKGLMEIPNAFLPEAGSVFVTEEGIRREIPVAQSDPYRLQVEDFAAALLEKRAPQGSLTETTRNLEILDRLYAASGK